MCVYIYIYIYMAPCRSDRDSGLRPRVAHGAQGAIIGATE